MNAFERARFEANVAAKATRLEAEGYQIEPDTGCPGRWWVTRPTGETTYAVDTNGSGWCGCPLFAAHGLCHHLAAACQADDRRMWDTLAAEYEACLAAEHALWGCDPDEKVTGAVAGSTSVGTHVGRGWSRWRRVRPCLTELAAPLRAY